MEVEKGKEEQATIPQGTCSHLILFPHFRKHTRLNFLYHKVLGHCIAGPFLNHIMAQASLIDYQTLH